MERDSPNRRVCRRCLTPVAIAIEIHTCGHVFCQDCITDWLARARTCPLDNRRVNVCDLRGPSRALHKLLSQLHVHVDENGRIPDWFSIDPFQICSEGCGMRVLREESRSHDCVQLLRSVITKLQAKRATVETLVRDEEQIQELYEREMRIRGLLLRLEQQSLGIGAGERRNEMAARCSNQENVRTGVSLRGKTQRSDRGQAQSCLDGKSDISSRRDAPSVSEANNNGPSESWSERSPREAINEFLGLLQKYCQNVQESLERLVLKKELEEFCTNVLSQLPPGRKFHFPKMEDLFCQYLRSSEDSVSCLDLSRAWDALFHYAVNLFSQPWRQDFLTMHLDSGYYIQHVQSAFPEGSEIFRLLGYVQSSEDESVLEFLKEVDLEKTLLVAKDCLLAASECRGLARSFRAEADAPFASRWSEKVEFHLFSGYPESLTSLKAPTREARSAGSNQGSGLDDDKACAAPGTWTCPRCTFLNKPLVEMCEMCSESSRFKRNLVSAENRVAESVGTRVPGSPRRRVADTLTLVGAEKGRKCPKCTFVNSSHAWKCSICENSLIHRTKLNK